MKLAIMAVGLVGTAMILGSLAWNVMHLRGESRDAARVQALLAYDEDVLYRNWNARHGGVYVRVTEETQPNPGLEGYPDRDVLTEGGLRLTLVNPPSMTREAHGDPATGRTVLSRLTSLNPLRRSNRPDPWEEEALHAFQDGGSEVSSIEHIDGKEYFRLMKPLVMTEVCLSCHAGQGYTAGSVRGGVSVAIPMAPMRAMESRGVLSLASAHGMLWIVGIAALFFGGRTMLRSERARAAAEEDIRHYALKLQESNRMKDLFTDIMRHDLLNPAGIIQCYADFILEREIDERTKEFGSRIRTTAERLLTMIEEASRFSELQGLDGIACEDLDLDVILREAIEEARERCNGGGLRFTYNGAGTMPIRANPLLNSVFSNLLSNAVKYAGDGRRVDVDVAESGPSWTVAVKDYGDGIPAEDREKVFCRFERLQKMGIQGSGLGLAIARHLVALHGGGIWVEENPAGGAVFKVRLPKEGPAAGSTARRTRLQVAV